MVPRFPQSLHLLVGCIVLLLSGLVYGQNVHAQPVPNDSLFHKQWALNPTLSTAHSRVLEAWQAQANHEPVIVAVIDTGIDWTHPDLVDNIWQNLAEDADGDGSTIAFLNGRWQLDPGDLDGVDQDANGYIDDLIGWDFFENDNNPYDFAGHGTHLAGVIGAVPNNRVGIAGINPNVRLMALRTGSTSHNLSYPRARTAMAYASENGAKVVNISWGSGSVSGSFQRAVQEAGANNVLTVAGIGNSRLDVNSGGGSFYPAAYPGETILAVGAHTAADVLWSDSNYGYLSVDLFAPGDSIWSTLPNDRYGPSGGTSMATAVVSGIASLVLSQNPSLTAIDVRHILMSSVTPQPVYEGKARSSGRINAAQALAQAQPSALRFETEDFGFGETEIRQVAARSMRVYNVTHQDRVLTFSSPDRAFKVPSPLRLAAQDSQIVTFQFVPEQTGMHRGSIKVSDGRHTYYLTGDGVGVAHPSIKMLKSDLAATVHVPFLPVGSESPLVHTDTLIWTNTGLGSTAWDISQTRTPLVSIEPSKGDTGPGDTTRVIVTYHLKHWPVWEGTVPFELKTQDPRQPVIRFDAQMLVTTEIKGLRDGFLVWGDYDADNDLDLLMTGRTQFGLSETLLYQNDGTGRFQKQVDALPDLRNAKSAAWGDYDADGDLDLIIGSIWGGQIFRNDQRAGFVEQHEWSEQFSKVQWGDYDSDGDLDGMATEVILRNDGSDLFTTVRVLPRTVSGSEAVWEDYDGDGDLDLFRFDAGGGLFRNPGDLQRLFLHIQKNTVSDQNRTDLAWVDLDADGHPDIVSAETHLVLYKQRPNATPAFVRQVVQPSIKRQSSIWGDFNNDGAWDMLGAGMPNRWLNDPQAGVVLYAQDASGVFDRSWNNAAAQGHALAWADFDNDNDLDFAVNQTTTVLGEPPLPLVVLHQNKNDTSNLAPEIPTNLRVIADSQGVYFTWDAAQDDHTPSHLLSYNLWVGTAADTFDVLVPMSDLKTGYRRIPRPGNASTGTTHTLYHIAPGTYHWGVQAIDGQFIGSPFAQGGAFTVSVEARNVQVVDSLWVGRTDPTIPGGDDFSDGPDNNPNPPPSIGDTGDSGDDGGVREGGQDFPPDQESPYPIQFRFHPAYPNPFDTAISLTYDLQTDAWVSLTIYNTLGRVVDVLVQRVQKAGRYTVEWQGQDRNGRTLPVGVYYARLEANDFMDVQSLVRTR